MERSLKGYMRTAQANFWLKWGLCICYPYTKKAFNCSLNKEAFELHYLRHFAIPCDMCFGSHPGLHASPLWSVKQTTSMAPKATIFLNTYFFWDYLRRGPAFDTLRPHLAKMLLGNKNVLSPPRCWHRVAPWTPPLPYGPSVQQTSGSTC